MRLSILRTPDLGGRGLVAGNVVEVAPLEAARLLAAGQAVHTPGAKITVPDGFAGFGSFASLPAASGGVMLAVATDLGPSGFALLRSDGTRWRPVAPLVLVSFNGGVSGETVAAGGAETAVGEERLLPAGLVQPGDVLRFMGWAQNATVDSNSHILAVRQGTSSGFALGSGQRLCRFTAVNATNDSNYVDKVGFVNTVTSAFWPTASAPVGYHSTTDGAAESMNSLDADSYLRLAVTPTAGTAWTVYGLSLMVFPGG